MQHGRTVKDLKNPELWGSRSTGRSWSTGRSCKLYIHICFTVWVWRRGTRGVHVRVKSPITTQLLLHLYRHLKDSFKQLPKPSMDGAGHPQIHTWAAPSWANFNPLCFSAALGQSLPLVTRSPFSLTAARWPVPPRPLSASFPATTNVEILPALSSCLSDFNNLCNPRDQMGFA